MKTYSIYARGYLTMEHCKQADEQIKSGMLEITRGDYDTVVFHGLKLEDIRSAQKLMVQFGFTVYPEIFEERIYGCFCDEVDVTDELDITTSDTSDGESSARGTDKEMYMTVTEIYYTKGQYGDVQHTKGTTTKSLEHIQSTTTNFDEVDDWDDINSVIIDIQEKRIIQTSGWSRDRGLFCDLY